MSPENESPQPDGLIGKSRQHLDTVHESYWEHMSFALYAVWMMLSASVLLLIHIVVPAWFQTSASTRILRLADDMRARRARMGEHHS